MLKSRIIMLLNISNHPSINWPDNQKSLALETYKKINDLPFPQIPPEMKSLELGFLVEEYLNKIQKINPLAVHIMGELTFTFSLVDLLMREGIKCIASTTQRNVEEDEGGVKKVRFEFVRFREYRRIGTAIYQK